MIPEEIKQIVCTKFRKEDSPYMYDSLRGAAYFGYSLIEENRNHLRQLLIESQQDVKTFQNAMEEANDRTALRKPYYAPDMTNPSFAQLIFRSFLIYFLVTIRSEVRSLYDDINRKRTNEAKWDNQYCDRVPRQMPPV